MKEVNMEEVKPQVEQGVPQEQASQPEVTQPSKSVEEFQKELERKEAEIKRLQGITRNLQKQGIPKEELNALHNKIDSLQDWVAEAMDGLVSQVSGEVVEPKRKTYRQQLDEQRAQTKPKTEPPLDPDAQRFLTYMASQGLNIEDDLVQEAIAEDRSPKEALKYLRGKIEATSQAMIEKRAKEIAGTIVEQKLKELGLTVSGAGSPSASRGKTFTRKQLADMSLEEYRANKEAITDAIRQGRIKD